jgi:hypothetical protein
MLYVSKKVITLVYDLLSVTREVAELSNAGHNLHDEHSASMNGFTQIEKFMNKELHVFRTRIHKHI